MLLLSCPLLSGWPACRYLQRRRDKKGPTFTYEVIVVDDGSTDATVRTAMEYVRRCACFPTLDCRLSLRKDSHALVFNRWWACAGT